LKRSITRLVCLLSFLLLLGLGCTGARTGPLGPVVDRIAFAGIFSAANQRGALYFVRTDSPGPERRFRDDPDLDASWPTWNPDGSSIVFAGWRAGDARIFVMNVTIDGRAPSAPRPLALIRGSNRLEQQTAWGRNGLIAYHDDGAIWTLPANAGLSTRPVRRTAVGIVARHPAWSLDGRLAFTVLDASQSPTITILRRDLTTTEASGIPGDEASWSDTYHWLLFTRGGNIVLRDLMSGSERTVISDGAQPVFGPESREIAFVRGGRIWVCDLNGGNAHPVSDGPNDRNPSWGRLDLR
jgi:hypothetical protein